MLSQTTKGLIAIGAGDADLRVRFLKYAADFFGSIAKGDPPSKPEPFVAEIVADTCAKLAGAEVPMPLADAVGTIKNKDGSKTAIPEIQEVPEAEQWLRSHNYGKSDRRPSRPVRTLLSAFLLNPTAVWRTSDLAQRLNKTRPSITRLASELRDVGILVMEGDKSTATWKLAEMPPHV